MSTETDTNRPERSPEQKLQSLIDRDINDEITRVAKAALQKRQEESAS